MKSINKRIIIFFLIISLVTGNVINMKKTFLVYANDKEIIESSIISLSNERKTDEANFDIHNLSNVLQDIYGLGTEAKVLDIKHDKINSKISVEIQLTSNIHKIEKIIHNIEGNKYFYEITSLYQNKNKEINILVVFTLKS